jgi:hypothetical protein
MQALSLLTNLHYMPCIEYFACLLPYDTIYLESQENYQKQTYRNRCYILGAQRIDRLSVPIIHTSQKQLYTKVKIDYSQPWARQHWRAICTAYGQAPYFEYFATYLKETLHTGYTHLFELNWAILKLCLQMLGIQKTFKLTDHYLVTPKNAIVDIRDHIHANKRLDASTYYEPCSYQQVFGTIFIPNLSIIDLLFCEGPHAYTILKKQVRNQRNNY